MAPSSGPLFCFGGGFVARRLAGGLLAQGWTVRATSRSEDGAARLSALGIAAEVFDGTVAPDLAGVTHVLVSTPPDRDTGADPVLVAAGDAIATARPAWVGYLSTTGVYGETGGAWVDEDAPLSSAVPRSQRRITAEAAWQAFGTDHDLAVHVFRLAGIYGPGRSLLDTVRDGRAKRIVKPGSVFGRIHVDDIVQVLRASIAQPRAGAAYNVADDEPAPSDEVTAFACDLLGVTPPAPVAFEDADLSDMARSFYLEDRRVKNDRIKTELGVRLRYPTYREGLTAVLAEERR